MTISDDPLSDDVLSGDGGGLFTCIPIAPAVLPKGSTYVEADVSASNDNSFINQTSTILHLRNTTSSPIGVDFVADSPEGVESVVMSVVIPGSGTANGRKRLGPFPASRFNNHSTTAPSMTGSVVFRVTSGTTGDLQACAEPLERRLFQG